MKRNIKKIITSMSALTVLAACQSTASAVLIEYDLDNVSYQEYIDTTIGNKMTDEEKLLPLFTYDNECKHIYFSGSEIDMNTYTTLNAYIEYGTDTYRTFTPCFIYWNKMSVATENADDFTVKELNEFLNNNNLKAQIKERTENVIKSHDFTGFSISIELDFDEDVTFDDIKNVVIALNSEYGFIQNGEFFASSVSFTDEKNPTIAGDLDLNDEQGISDIVALTKYTASPELYPITDPTALANADINKDGTIDSVDTSILVEIMLGTYESAV